MALLSTKGNSRKDDLDDQKKRKACLAFQAHVDKLPDLQAMLRHYLTIPCKKQRTRLLLELKNKNNKLTSYKSDYYPLEAHWYMETLLSKQIPTFGQLWWLRNGVLPSKCAIYSYIDEQTGLLVRHQITLLVNPTSNDFLEELDIAAKYRDIIIELGGLSSIYTQAPDIRNDAFNVVIGFPKQKWTTCCIPLYSPLLLMEVLKRGKFTSAIIDEFKIPQIIPTRLNFHYLTQIA